MTCRYRINRRNSRVTRREIKEYLKHDRVAPPRTTPRMTPRMQTRKPKRDPWAALLGWLAVYVLAIAAASLVGQWIGGVL